MSERKFSTPKLYVDHEPDSSNETDANGVKYSAALPGFLEIGVVIDGVKVPLTRRKAGALLPAFDEAKAQAKASESEASDDKTDE